MMYFEPNHKLQISEFLFIVMNILTFRNRITELILKSSKNPQIRTTISVMVGSQKPLLQNPVLQGVPSGSIGNHL